MGQVPKIFGSAGFAEVGAVARAWSPLGSDAFIAKTGGGKVCVAEGAHGMGCKFSFIVRSDPRIYRKVCDELKYFELSNMVAVKVKVKKVSMQLLT